MTPNISRSGDLPALNLPAADLKVIQEKGTCRIFDPLRKKYVVLTPEEYVRQHFVSWLMTSLHYPCSLMANEIGIELNGTRKRCDTVVFNPDGTPFMIVEYKAPSVGITQMVFDQIARYNMVLHARLLVVSNGISHYCCVMDYSNNSYHFLPSVPDYHEFRNADNK